MRSFSSYCLLLLLAAATTFGGDLHRVDLSQLPKGWVALIDSQPSWCGSATKFPPAFRNSDGTIWIIVQTFDKETFLEFSGNERLFQVIDSDSTDQFQISTLQELVSSEAPGSAYLIVPELNTFFGVCFTKNGSLDIKALLTQLRIPKGKEFERLLGHAKKAVMELVENTIQTEQGAAANP